jgi:transposase
VGPNPTDRGKPGTKDHVVSDRQGIPLVSLETAANVNEGTVLLDAIDAIPPIKRPRGRPRRRPAKLHADKAYHGRARRDALRRRHIAPRIARPGLDSTTRLGRHRWIVERDFAWLHRNRRLLVRFERRDDLHAAFLHLGCALICWNFCSDDFC